MPALSLELPDPSATAAFGRRLGRSLQGGDVVGLVGPLGAGKTFLVRAVAEGLGVRDSRAVTSPTFVLWQEYDASVPIYHFDVYRLPTQADFLGLGVEEILGREGVALIEWADRVEDCLPPDTIWVRISHTGESSRRLEMSGQGNRFERLIGSLSLSSG